MNAASRLALRPLWRFAALTFGFSWLCWLPVVLALQNVINSAFIVLYFLGGCGPSLAGLYLAYEEGGRAGLRAFARRVFELRFGLKWWLVIALTWPLVFGLAAFLASRTGGSPYPYSPLGKILEAQPWVILPLVLVSLASGALSEEYGWRGYAQERLQAGLGKADASLGIGLAWGLWQLPLFGMVGTAHSNMSLPLYLLSVLGAAFIFTAVYNGAGRSLGAAVALRFTFNLALLFVPLLDRVMFAFLVGLLFLIAVPLGVGWLIENRLHREGV